MARKPVRGKKRATSRTKSTVLAFTQSERRDLLPEGDYVGVVESCKLSDKEGPSGYPQMLFGLKVTEGKEKGGQITDFRSISPQALWAIFPYADAAGISTDEDYQFTDGSDFEGAEVSFSVEKDGEYMRVVSVEPAQIQEEEEEEDEEGEGGDFPSTEEIGKMSLEELQAVVEDYELGSEVPEKGTAAVKLRKFRKAVSEEIANIEEEEEKDDEPEEDEEGEDSSYTEEGIKKMRKSSLVKIIEDEELDLDPDSEDYEGRKGVATMRDDVIDALADAGLL